MYKYRLKNVSPSRRPRDKRYSTFYSIHSYGVGQVLANRWQVLESTTVE